MITAVDMNRMTITTDDGKEHDLWRHEYWYLSPAKTSWSPSDGIGSPLQFAFILHNARKGQGLVLAQEDLLVGIQPVSLKAGNAREAEDLLEEVRLSEFPTRPSRLRCHYLNYDKRVAEERVSQWRWQSRHLTTCYIVCSGGVFHHADVGIFERLACDPRNRQLARQYWEVFSPSTLEEFSRLEVLANSALYFPEWQTFPELDVQALAQWSDHLKATRKQT